MFGSKKEEIDVIAIIFNPHRSYIDFINYFYKKNHKNGFTSFVWIIMKLFLFIIIIIVKYKIIFAFKRKR